MLDEDVLEGKAFKDEVEKVIYEMQNTHYWIPAFPNDGRTSYGWVIVVALSLWLGVFLFLGGAHHVTGLSAIIYTAGACLLAYLIGFGAYYWAHNPIGDKYLIKREKTLIDVAEAFNIAKLDREFKLEVGRYGAYIALRFSTPIKQLGALLLQYHRVYKKHKENDNQKQTQEADLL